MSKITFEYADGSELTYELAPGGAWVCGSLTLPPGSMLDVVESFIESCYGREQR